MCCICIIGTVCVWTLLYYDTLWVSYWWPLLCLYKVREKEIYNMKNRERKREEGWSEKLKNVCARYTEKKGINDKNKEWYDIYNVQDTLYTIYYRSLKDKRWYCFNDQSVSRVSHLYIYTSYFIYVILIILFYICNIYLDNTRGNWTDLWRHRAHFITWLLLLYVQLFCQCLHVNVQKNWHKR